jgi:hypothetical protein
MSTTKEYENLLSSRKQMEDKRPGLFRLKRFLDEKREKGIVKKKGSKVPTLQEIERYGYESFFSK